MNHKVPWIVITGGTTLTKSKYKQKGKTPHETTKVLTVLEVKRGSAVQPSRFTCGAPVVFHANVMSPDLDPFCE